MKRRLLVLALFLSPIATPPAMKVVEATLTPKPALPPIDMGLPQVGDRIGGFEVSSTYGARDTCDGVCSGYHEGVDLATPIGTPVRVPVDAEVRCHDKSEGNGAGTYAVILPKDDRHPGEFGAFHLERCTPGDYKLGEVFGLTGSTGNSTGPHLHFAQKDVRGKGYVKPWRGYLKLMMGDTRTIDEGLETAKAVAVLYAGREIGSAPILTSSGTTLLITNFHVVKEVGVGGKVSGQLPDGRRFEGEVLKVNVEDDLALILSSATGLPTVTLDRNPVQDSEEVVAIGYPYGKPGQEKGQVESVGDNALVTTSNVRPGFSGGCVIRRSSKGCIGITSNAMNGGRSRVRSMGAVDALLKSANITIAQ
jgi:S1-C subfamily serine protease